MLTASHLSGTAPARHYADAFSQLSQNSPHNGNQWHLIFISIHELLDFAFKPLLSGNSKGSRDDVWFFLRIPIMRKNLYLIIRKV